MKEYFSYYSEEIPIEKVFELNGRILLDLYIDSSEVERLNIFFHLQNEYFYLKNKNRVKETAYICYLISCYIFSIATPPHSEELALEYAKMALELEDKKLYRDWIEEVKAGN